MNDDQLSQALKSLPREPAGLGFTAGVLRRIEAPSRLMPARWIAAAAVAVLVLTLGFGWREWRHRQAAQNLQVLLAEKQDLQAEIEALRRLAEEARPVVYLGSDNQVDLVLDLARFKRQGGFGSNLPAGSAVDYGPDVAPATGSNDMQEERTVRPLRVVY